MIYTINGVLTVESDLNENTIMDVAQDLGCDIMLDYLFESRIYDKLRDNGKLSNNQSLSPNSKVPL